MRSNTAFIAGSRRRTGAAVVAGGSAWCSEEGAEGEMPTTSTPA